MYFFGASNTLDRAYYLEFEYHSVGNWGRLHLPDAVRLLNVKGYTCYWQGSGKLWRITNCYLPIYNTWHGWSNVACVHRSHHTLAKRMEHMFQSAYENEYVNNSDIYLKWCGNCKTGIHQCDARKIYFVNHYKMSVVDAMKALIKKGDCEKQISKVGNESQG